MITIEKKSLKVGKYVNTEHVDTVIRNYKKERWVHNSERIGKEDSLSVWYSIEELEDFIETIKEYGADGIKFYFGAYSSDFPERPKFADRQTIVLVATRSKMTENGDTANKDVYLATDKGTTILAYNTGDLCPPHCVAPGTGDSEWGGIGITIVDDADKGLKIV